MITAIVIHFWLIRYVMKSYLYKRYNNLLIEASLLYGLAILFREKYFPVFLNFPEWLVGVKTQVGCGLTNPNYKVFKNKLNNLSFLVSVQYKFKHGDLQESDFQNPEEIKF